MAQVSELAGRLAPGHSYILALEAEVDEMRADRLAMLVKLSCDEEEPTGRCGPKEQADGSEFVKRLKVWHSPCIDNSVPHGGRE